MRYIPAFSVEVFNVTHGKYGIYSSHIGHSWWTVYHNGGTTLETEISTSSWWPNDDLQCLFFCFNFIENIIPQLTRVQALQHL